MPLVDTNIVTAPGGSLVASLQQALNPVKAALFKKAENDREDSRLAQVKQITDQKNRAAGMFTQLSRIVGMSDPRKQRAELAKLGSAEIQAGRDGSVFIEALNADTPTQLGLNIVRAATAMGNKAGLFGEVLKANNPQPLSKKGKEQSDVSKGFLTQDQADKTKEGLASAISEFLEGGGTRKVLPNGKEEVTNRFGEVVTGQAAVDVIDRSAKIKADREKATQDLRVETERSIQQVKNAESTSKSAFETVDKLRQHITNLEKVIPLVGEGANTGPITDLFPSIKAATIKLKQLQKRLGLDVVGAAKFGALSAGELDLALSVALPTNLQGDDLIDWTNDAIAAKRKLATYFEDQAIFLSNGGTQAGWLEKQRTDLSSLLSRANATEQDIRQTMKDNNMSRPQVLEELKRRFPSGS